MLKPTMMQQLIHECSDFITESGGNMLYKCLPNNKEDISKIKLRKRNYKSQVDKFFDATHQEEEIRRRSLIAHTGGIECDDKLCYVFPINGYSFMYNENVSDLREAYANILQLVTNDTNSYTLVELKVLQELIRDSYRDSDLLKSFSKPCEIMFYNIPYYYAIDIKYYEDNGLCAVTNMSHKHKYD